MERIKLKKPEKGKCPYCGSHVLDYGVCEHYDGMLMYPVHCETCGRNFEEWYSLRFAGQNVGENLDIEVYEGTEITM